MKYLLTITSGFTVFGDLMPLILKIENVKALFAGFECQEGVERLPNGSQAKNYVLHSNNKIVTIRNYRLDIQYNYEVGTIDDFLYFVNQVSEKIKSTFNLRFNRVAYISSQFVRKEEMTMANFNKAFNLASVFGEDAKEIQFRVNHIYNILGEPTNAVLIAQDGTVQKRGEDTKEKVIIINNDINTLAENKEDRFDWQASINLLKEYIKLAAQRSNRVVGTL